MKKILVLNQDMQISGVSRALLSLLHSFDAEKYSVDLFLRSHEGDFLKYIPRSVRLLPENKAYKLSDRTTAEAVKGGKLLLAAGKAYGMLKARSFAKKHSLELSAVALDYTQRYQLPFLPRISEEEYDLVISFVAPHYYGAYKCRAKKRLSWIHTDYSRLGIDVKSEERVWSKYDGIASISDLVGEAFASRLPSLSDKLVRIDNPVSPSLIRESALEGQSVMAKEGIRIVSCGTLSSNKNFRSVPEMVSVLLSYGLDVRWYIVGEGPDRPEIERRIRERELEDRIFLLGRLDNPYPYMKECDLYVHPSLYEGKAVAVREAQILGCAVVITDFLTSRSQLSDGFDGVIVPLDTVGCANAIAELLKDEKRLTELRNNCRSSDYGSEKDMERVCSFAE